jgi:superfamily II DNA/RNA helicase
VALELHGDLDQRERDQVLVQFANRSCSVLVASDVVAGGLDIARFEAVINVDITPEVQVHSHRVGRIEEMQGSEGVWHPLSVATAQDDAALGPLRPPMVTLQILGGPREHIAGFEPREAAPPASSPTGGIKGRRKSKKDKLRETAGRGRVKSVGSTKPANRRRVGRPRERFTSG